MFCEKCFECASIAKKSEKIEKEKKLCTGKKATIEFHSPARIFYESIAFENGRKLITKRTDNNRTTLK